MVLAVAFHALQALLSVLRALQDFSSRSNVSDNLPAQCFFPSSLHPSALSGQVALWTWWMHSSHPESSVHLCVGLSLLFPDPMRAPPLIESLIWVPVIFENCTVLSFFPSFPSSPTPLHFLPSSPSPPAWGLYGRRTGKGSLTTSAFSLLSQAHPTKGPWKWSLVLRSTPESRVTSFPSVPPYLFFSCPGLLISGFCLFVFGHTIRLLGSSFPDQRLNPPLISESAESYLTGPPGNSLGVSGPQLVFLSLPLPQLRHSWPPGHHPCTHTCPPADRSSWVWQRALCKPRSEWFCV